MDVEPRRIVLLGLLALIPGAVYMIGTGHLVTAIALLNVVIIVAALWLATSDTIPLRASPG